MQRYLRFFTMSNSKTFTKPAEYHRLWSNVTKTCLALTLKENSDEVESVKCKESVRVDRPRESSKLQLLMLMNSFLSLLALQRNS